MSKTIEVTIEAEAPDSEVEALQDLFDRAGIRVTVEPHLLRASVTKLPWAMILRADIAVLSLAFLKAFGDEAGRETWRGLKTFVTRVYELRRRPDRRDGQIRVDEKERTIVLTDDIPDEGFRELLEGETPAGSYLVWDKVERRWQARF